MNKFMEFKPHAGNNSTAAIVFIFGLILFIFMIILFNYLRKNYNFKNARSFSSFARNIGLNYEEIRTLYRLTLKYNVKYPLSCFTNVKLLDDLLKNGLHSIDLDKHKKIIEKDRLSAVLLSIKTKIEANSRKNIGIRSTHLIGEGQKLVLFIRDKGYFYAVVRHNLKDYLEIQLISKFIQQKMMAKDEFIKVYFWRNEDAGYTFETKVKNTSSSIYTYYIYHSDKLIRSQKRKYRRIPVNLKALVSRLIISTKANKRTYSVVGEGINGTIKDLSAGGLRLFVNNLNDQDKFIKVDFMLGLNKISMIGKIIRMNQSAGGIKEVTILFIKITNKDNILINKFVYNYLPEFK